MAIDPLATARIGSTGVTVTRMGLGTAPLGGWPDPLPEDQALATVRRAWDRGIRYFDTAPFYGYGLSETLLGKELGGQPRDAFHLSTKVGRLLVPGAVEDPFYKGALPMTPVFDFSYDGVMRSLEESRDPRSST